MRRLLSAFPLAACNLDEPGPEPAPVDCAEEVRQEIFAEMIDEMNAWAAENGGCVQSTDCAFIQHTRWFVYDLAIATANEPAWQRWSEEQAARYEDVLEPYESCPLYQPILAEPYPPDACGPYAGCFEGRCEIATSGCWDTGHR